MRKTLSDYGFPIYLKKKRIKYLGVILSESDKNG
jgi:hypothetical protein